MNPAPVRIWLCADDYGISPSVNGAIRDLIARKRINATSVMVVAPGFDRSEAVSLRVLNAKKPRAALGLHLTLSAPYRPLHANYTPLAGRQFLPLGKTMLRAFLRRLDPNSLKAEIAAQLDAFIAAFDRAPDFVDGHQHVQLLPQVRDAMLEVVKAKAPHAWVRQCGSPTSASLHAGDRKRLVLNLLSRGFRARAKFWGVRTNPAFAGAYDFDAGNDFASLFPGFLDRLPENGVVVCHPGLVDAELERIDPLTTQREREYAYFADERFPAILAAHGVALA